MSFILVTPQVTLARNAGALYNYGLGSELMTSLASFADLNGLLNSIYVNSIGSTATSQVAKVFVANLGIKGDSAVKLAEDYVVAQLNSVAVSGRGKVINDILTAFSGLTGDPTFGTFATDWNTKVAAAVAYAAKPGSVDGTWAVATSAGAAQTFMLTASAASAEEGGIATFQLTLDKAPTSAVTVNYATAAGTASLSDYVSAAGTVTFAAGQTTAFVNVSTVADSAFEADETFTVSFSGSSLSSSVSATGTIKNDDVDTANLPKTYTLTANADTTLVGGAGNDIYVGVIGAGGGATTLNPGDLIDGKGGTDTLSLSIAGTGATTSTSFVLSGVENLSLTNYETSNTGNTLNLTQASELKNVALTGSAATGSTLVTNLGSVVALEMGGGEGSLSVTYSNAAVAGTSDVQQLTLRGQTYDVVGLANPGTFTVKGTTAGGVETLDINSVGSDNAIVLKDAVTATIKTINISGDKFVEIWEDSTDPADAVTVINASNNTGGVYIETGSAAQNLSITGGGGDDTFAFTGTTFTLADTIDGGAGDDTVVLQETTIANTAFAKATNVEIVNLAGSNAVMTLGAGISATTFDLAASSNASQTVILASGYTGATTVLIDNGGTGDNVNNSGANVALTVSGTQAAFALATIIGGTGTDSLTIRTSGQAPTSLAFTNITAVDAIIIRDNGDAPSGSSVKGNDATLTLGAYATALTIDGSALDAGTPTGTTMGADDETLTVDGSSATKSLTVSGGEGRDTIIGGLGNDVLRGNGGNDSISGASGGADLIEAGAGSDIINMGGALTSADTIDGGDGNDTVIVTSLSASTLTGITNVETLAFTGSATLAGNLSFGTIDLRDGTNVDSLTFATGYTSATTVMTDVNDTVVDATTAGVALTVEFSSDDAVNITAGVATTDTSDSIRVKASTSTVSTQGVITGVDSIVVLDNGDATTGSTGLAGEDITIDLTSYATRLTIDASALDKGTQNATTGDDNSDYETLTITGTASAALTVTGGGGADTLVGSSSATAGDSLVGGGGNDSFTMAGNLSYMDTIDGGDNTDRISAATGLTDIAFMNVRNVEVLTLGGTATLGSYLDAAGIATVNLEGTTGSAVDASGTNSTRTFVAGSGAESIAGGLGADTFRFSGTTQLTIGDSINGGAGTDTIQLNNAGGAVTAVIALDLVTKVENVTVRNANGGDTVGSENADAISVTLQTSSGSVSGINTSNSTDDTDVVMTVDASVITDALDTVTVTAVTVNDPDYRFSIIGGGAKDTLTGGGGNDTVSGNGGADLITGGLGLDSLTGGSGADTFVFNATVAGVIDSGGSSVDVVSDFTASSDRLRVVMDDSTSSAASSYDFTDKGDVTSTADALSLLSGKIGQYVFNTTNAQLVMDTTGNAVIQATDLIVTLSGNTGLSSADVDINLITSAGASSVTTGDGNDTVLGGAGNDTIIGGGGNDSLSGAAGNDGLTGGAGNDTLTGGVGEDALTGSTGTDTVSYADVTGATSHSLTNVAGVAVNLSSAAVTAATISSEMGGTVVIGGGNGVAGADLGAGTAGYLAVNAAGSATSMVRDTLATIEGVLGSALADYIQLGSSGMTADGGAGSDVIYGGAGSDSIVGGAGDDLLTADPSGQSANSLDTLVGGEGADYLRGVPGGGNVAQNALTLDNDLMFAGAATTAVNGVYPEGTQAAVTSGVNASFSSIWAPFSTTYAVFANANILEGRAGNDVLVASTEKDVFFYKTFENSVMAGASITAAGFIGTDVIHGFTLGEDFIAVVLGRGAGGTNSDEFFVSDSTGSKSGSQSFFQASLNNGWTWTAGSTAGTGTLSFDSSAHTGFTNTGTEGDFSISFVGLSGTVTSVDDFFPTST